MSMQSDPTGADVSTPANVEPPTTPGVSSGIQKPDSSGSTSRPLRRKAIDNTISWVQRLSPWTEPVDKASDLTLRMQLDNLHLRFQRIDPSTLNSNELPIYWGVAAAVGYDVPEAQTPNTGSSPEANKPGTRPRLNWDDAARIETEICGLLKGDRLRHEVEVRLKAAVAKKLESAADFQTDFANLAKLTPPASDELYRDLLFNILEEIHWANKHKFIARKIRSQAARRTLILAVIALFLALSPYVLIVPGEAPPANAKTAFLLAVEQSAPPRPESPFAWSVHFALYSSLMFGVVGALFSRLMNLQTQWSVMPIEELYNVRAYSFIALRASIGIVGAMVIYFFLQAGIIAGSLFPNFDKLSMTTLSNEATKWPLKLVLPSLDMAKLIMWSFVAGFSESLIPNVLSSTEKQFSAAVASKPSP